MLSHILYSATYCVIWQSYLFSSNLSSFLRGSSSIRSKLSIVSGTANTISSYLSRVMADTTERFIRVGTIVLKLPLKFAAVVNCQSSTSHGLGSHHVPDILSCLWCTKWCSKCVFKSYFSWKMDRVTERDVMVIWVQGQAHLQVDQARLSAEAVSSVRSGVISMPAWNKNRYENPKRFSLLPIRLWILSRIIFRC